MAFQLFEFILLQCICRLCIVCTSFIHLSQNCSKNWLLPFQ